MQIFSYLLGFIAVAASAWWITYTLTDRKHTGRIRDLESKILSAQGESLHLKEQVGSLKGEVAGLQRALGDERVSKQEALVALSQSFHQGLVSVGIMAFVMGSGIVGGMSWMAATWRAEARLVTQNTDQRIQFELTKLKLELLEKQFSKSEKDRISFQSAWQDEQIMRTVAETRLETLMGGLSMPQTMETFSGDDIKLRQGPEEMVQKKSGAPISLLRETPFKP